MFDHFVFPLIVAVALGFGVDRQASGGQLLWWPPSTWHAPSGRALRLGSIAFVAGVAASLVAWWITLPVVALVFAIEWARHQRLRRA